MIKKITQNEGPFRVGFLLIDGFSLLTYSSATEPLRAANELANEELYEIWNIPAQGARASASCGAIVPANAHVGERDGFDMVLVVASEDSVEAQQPRLLDWLRLLARRKVTVGGIGAGPLMLARAGLLRNTKTTIHWPHRGVLEELHPELNVVSGVYAMGETRVSCAAGVAPMDLMSQLIGDQHGAELARKVSDWWSYTAVRDSTDAQRSSLSERHAAHNEVVVEAIELMENHLADPLDLAQLSDAVGASQRQLNRAFQKDLQERTMNFYRHLRLKHSLALLKQTSMTISAVMAATGFSNATHFGRCFKEAFGDTPTQARAKRRGVL